LLRSACSQKRFISDQEAGKKFVSSSDKKEGGSDFLRAGKNGKLSTANHGAGNSYGRRAASAGLRVPVVGQTEGGVSPPNDLARAAKRETLSFCALVVLRGPFLAERLVLLVFGLEKPVKIHVSTQRDFSEERYFNDEVAARRQSMVRFCQEQRRGSTSGRPLPWVIVGVFKGHPPPDRRGKMPNPLVTHP